MGERRYAHGKVGCWIWGGVRGVVEVPALRAAAQPLPEARGAGGFLPGRPRRGGQDTLFRGAGESRAPGRLQAPWPALTLFPGETLSFGKRGSR